MEKNQIAYLIRGEKWFNIRKVKVLKSQTKEVEWMDAQKSIVADIKAYEEFMEKMQAVDKKFKDLGDLDAYEKTIAEQETPAEEEIDYSSMTVEELKAALDEKEIEYDSGDLKADLIALLEG
jgi:thymidylate synthase